MAGLILLGQHQILIEHNYDEKNKLEGLTINSGKTYVNFYLDDMGYLNIDLDSKDNIYMDEEGESVMVEIKPNLGE